MLNAWRTSLSRFWNERSGSAAIEYALIAILIAITIVAACLSIGTNLSGWFSTVATSL